MSKSVLALLLIAIYVMISLWGVYYKMKMDGEKHPIDFFFGKFRTYRWYIGGHWHRVQLLDNKNDYNIAIPTQKLWVRHEDMESFRTRTTLKYYVIEENSF